MPRGGGHEHIPFSIYECTVVVMSCPLLDADYFHFWITLFHVWFCGSPSMVIVIIVSMEICCEYVL